MNYEFLLPLIGAGVAAAWTYGKSVPESKTEKLTFVEDEVPLTGIKDDDVVLTQTGQVFKVVALSGQSVAGKRADDLEKAASARALFFRRISESKVHLRLVSQKTLTPVSKKPPCGNPFLDALVERWESGLETSFKTRHYIIVSSTSENEVDAVIREIFIALSDLEPVVLTKSGKDGVSPLLTFLSSFYNAEEIPVSDKEKNIHRIERSRIKIDRNGLITQTRGAAAALFFYLFKKIEKNAQSGKPSLLIVDEAPTLLSSQPLKTEIEKLLKTARKQRMAIFMAFQGTNDLKTLNIKETILTNCHTRFFYDGCAGTPEEIDGFNLTESETDFVLTKGAKIEGAKRPVLMQRNGVNVFLETDMSCLGNYLNAFKGGAKAVRFLDYAKLFKPEDPAAYYLKHYGANR